MITGASGSSMWQGKHAVALGVDNDPIRVRSSHPNSALFIGLTRAL